MSPHVPPRTHRERCEWGDWLANAGWALVTVVVFGLLVATVYLLISALVWLASGWL